MLENFRCMLENFVHVGKLCMLEKLKIDFSDFAFFQHAQFSNMTFSNMTQKNEKKTPFWPYKRRQILFFHEK